jgi:hypothetical protein
MRESCTSGSVRGARGNSRPYRDASLLRLLTAACGTKRQAGNVRFRAAVGAITDVKRRLFYHPCLARRLGGVLGGKETQGWRDSSHTPMVGAGKFGSAKLPMATATYPGKPSFSQ